MPEVQTAGPSASRSARSAAFVATLSCAGLFPAAPAAAQDFNFVLAPDRLEHLLGQEQFEIIDWRGSRAPGDRTQRVALKFADHPVVLAKWATAPRNGGSFNNEPRFELAAYRLQKLFLDEASRVVPPTVIRSFDLDFVRAQIPEAAPTFREAPGSVLVALQYWLSAVSPENFWDEDRARTDTLYARHIGNMNIVTHLINHSDANVGNFLISLSPTNPRVFSVDNGVSFSSLPSDRGTHWRRIRVPRLPRATIDRLRALSPDQLVATLGVLAEFEIRAGRMVPVPPTVNLDPRRGVRTRDDRIQIGLTSSEIDDVADRLRSLLEQADRGRIVLF